MSIITIIKDGQRKIATGDNAEQTLSALNLNVNITSFQQDTLQKVSNSLGGSIPSFKNNTEPTSVGGRGRTPKP